MRRLPLAIVLTLLAGAAQAQDLREFCAQRPGRATPPCILDAGHLQLEVGLADAVLQRHGGDHEDTDTYLAPALRLGLTRRFELEASAIPYVLDAARGSGRTKGVGDTTFGLLGAITDPDGEGPAVSVLASSTPRRPSTALARAAGPAAPSWLSRRR